MRGVATRNEEEVHKAAGHLRRNAQKPVDTDLSLLCSMHRARKPCQRACQGRELERRDGTLRMRRSAQAGSDAGKDGACVMRGAQNARRERRTGQPPCIRHPDRHRSWLPGSSETQTTPAS